MWSTVLPKTGSRCGGMSIFWASWWIFCNQGFVYVWVKYCCLTCVPFFLYNGPILVYLRQHGFICLLFVISGYCLSFLWFLNRKILSKFSASRDRSMFSSSFCCDRFFSWNSEFYQVHWNVNKYFDRNAMQKLIIESSTGNQTKSFQLPC